MTPTTEPKGSIGKCKSPNCGATIWWVRSEKTGKMSPVNLDHSSHFATCPDAQIFSRKKVAQPDKQTAKKFNVGLKST